MEWAARAIGAFYVFAGLVVIRHIRMDMFLDRAIAAITLEKPKPGLAERGRMAWSVMIAGTTLASGVGLLFLSRFAPWLFALCALLQAGFLLWAARFLPAKEGPDAAGRRNTINAFVIFLAATAFVFWLHYQGRLR